jgi:hypothetical protein
MQLRMLLITIAGMAQLAAALPMSTSTYPFSLTISQDLLISANSLLAPASGYKRGGEWILIGGASCVKAKCYDRVVEGDADTQTTETAE